jgi:hypothetical protein
MLFMRIIASLAPLITFIIHGMETTRARQPLHTIKYDWTNFSSNVIKTCFYEHYIDGNNPIVYQDELAPLEYVERFFPENNNGLEPAEYNYRVVASNHSLSFCAAHNSDFSDNPISIISLEKLVERKRALEKIIHQHATVSARVDEKGILSIELMHLTGAKKGEK